MYFHILLDFIALIPMWMDKHMSMSHATHIMRPFPNHSNMRWLFPIEIALDQPLCDFIMSEYLSAA